VLGIGWIVSFFIFNGWAIVQEVHNSGHNTLGQLLTYSDAHSCKQGILLNDYNIGGYILLVSRQRVFIDGRGPQLPLGDGQTLLQAYDQIVESPATKVGPLLTYYGISRVLMEQSTLDSSVTAGFRSFLTHSSAWYQVSPSGTAVLYQSTSCLPKSD